MAVEGTEAVMKLGKMLAEALAQEGFALPSGSGTAEQSIQAAAEAFLAKVREAEKAESSDAAATLVPPYTMDT